MQARKMTPTKIGSMTTDMEKKDRERQRKENKERRENGETIQSKTFFRMLQRTIAVLAKLGENGNGTILKVVGCFRRKRAEGIG